MSETEGVKINTVKQGLDVIHKLQAKAKVQKEKINANNVTYKRKLDDIRFKMNIRTGLLIAVAVGGFLVGWLVL